MNKRSLGALIVLNAVLLIALALASFSPQPAHAQLGAAGEYVMVPGELIVKPQYSVVYIIDIRTGAMVAAAFDGGNNSLQPLASYNIAEDLHARGQ